MRLLLLPVSRDPELEIRRRSVEADAKAAGRRVMNAALRWFRRAIERKLNFEEVLADTWERFKEKVTRNQFRILLIPRPKKNGFVRYVNKILWHCVDDASVTSRRRQERERSRLSTDETLGTDAATEPTKVVMIKELLERAESCAERLRPRYRKALKLWAFEGLGHLEIAKRLRISVENSRVLRNRALAQLRILVHASSGAS